MENSTNLPEQETVICLTPDAWDAFQERLSEPPRELPALRARLNESRRCLTFEDAVKFTSERYSKALRKLSEL